MADDIREELARVAAVALDAGIAEGFEVDESFDFWQQSAFAIADAILASPVIARVRAEAIVSLADQLVDESIAVNNNAIGKPQAEWLLSLQQAERLSIAAEVIRAHASIRSGSEED